MYDSFDFLMIERMENCSTVYPPQNSRKKNKERKGKRRMKAQTSSLRKRKKKEKRGRTTFQQSLRYNKDSSHTELFLTASVCYKKLLHSQFACT